VILCTKQYGFFWRKVSFAWGKSDKWSANIYDYEIKVEVIFVMGPRTTGLTLLLVGAILKLVNLCFIAFMILAIIFLHLPSTWLLILISGVFLIALIGSIITIVGFIIFRKDYKASFTPTTPTVPTAPPIATSAVFCTRCGRQITSLDTVFCPSCGSKIER